MKTSRAAKETYARGNDLGNIATLRALRDELQRFGPPVVVFNKSHSGSRLLAGLIAEAGIFMGAHQNESNDSWDILEKSLKS
jgi:hypothetical protein